MAEEGTPYDVSILYMDDACEWCEYLFDVFQPFDVYQNSENITKFPTHESTVEAIKSSKIQVLIVSPVFLQNIDSNLEDITNKVVALLCGVDESELSVLRARVPSYIHWHYIQAQADPRPLTQKVLGLLDEVDSGEEEVIGENPESTYIVMTGVPPPQDDNNYEPFDPKVETEDIYVTPVPPDEEEGFGIYDFNDFNAFTIVPSRLQCDRDKQFYILFQDERLSKSNTYTAALNGQQKQSVATCTVLNPYTLVVDAPQDHPAESVALIIQQEREDIVKGRLDIINPVERIAGYLEELTNPIEFMCQSLNLASNDLNGLDDALHDKVKDMMNIESIEKCLLVDHESQQDASNKLYPTALHFAAYYGLRKITCSYLTKLPGSAIALKMKNKNGHTPAELAGFSKHPELKDILEQIVQKMNHADPNAGYASMNQAAENYKNVGPSNRYDKPCAVALPAVMDESKVRHLMEEGTIYDMFFSKDRKAGWDEKDDDEDSNKSDYELLAQEDKELLGPNLPEKMKPNAPKALIKQPSKKEKAENESQDALIQINTMFKDGKITLDKSMELFKEWQKKYNQNMPDTVATSKKSGDKKKPKQQKRVGASQDTSPRTINSPGGNTYNSFNSVSGRIKKEPLPVPDGARKSPAVTKRTGKKKKVPTATLR